MLMGEEVDAFEERIANQREGSKKFHKFSRREVSEQLKWWKEIRIRRESERETQKLRKQR